MKTVIITGAGGNLGKAAVDKFLSAGYRVLATVSPGKTPNLAAHDHLEIYPVDLADEKSVEATTATMFARHDAIDAAMLLAGGYAGGGIQGTDGPALQKMYTLNFETAYFMARFLFLQMQKQSTGGRIVLVGSRPSLRATDGRSALAYALAKSLLFKLADFLNAEGSKQNVVTSVIVPSTIDTPENRRAMPQADFLTWVSVDEIAETLLFIANATALREPVFKLYGKA